MFLSHFESVEGSKVNNLINFPCLTKFSAMKQEWGMKFLEFKGWQTLNIRIGYRGGGWFVITFNFGTPIIYKS